MSFISTIRAAIGTLQSIENRCKLIQQGLGRVELRQLHSVGDLKDSEFTVYSQWGEDGIIQFLLKIVPVPNRIFVEFGVEDYTESNTRFLLVNDNWAGLVIDGSPEKVAAIKKDEIYWRHNLKAECAFITRENINEIIERSGISGEIGLLSIDIDGNDYWVWEAISAISPGIVVVEYNSRFGPDKAVTIPYDPRFVRTTAHYSNIYYGASLPALCLLAKRKGYSFVGCNRNGSNAFFVKNELRPTDLRELSVTEGFVAAKIRESRGRDGQLAFLSEVEEASLLDGMPLVEILQRVSQ